MKSTRKIIFLALLIAIGVVLGIVENSLPVPIPIPGAKLGFANIIQLIVIVLLGYKESLLTAFLRTFIVAIGTGNFSGLLYSLPSAIFSTIAMITIYNFFKDKFSLMGISIIGALIHNLTQILVAVAIMNNIRIAVYYPYMALVSLFTGYFTGIAVYFFVKNSKKIIGDGEII
ncbi:MAG: Gx transporter family protein [Andreesenia angusta]|nr:Gx transporter family protein [Andreesenia angusta]